MTITDPNNPSADSLVSRGVGLLPGWLFTASGMALIAMATLTPPWLQCRQLKWQQDIMKLQADGLQTQEQAYRRFFTALKSKDPVLLERLAYHQLRLKPTGVLVFNPPAQAVAPPEHWQREGPVAANDPQIVAPAGRGAGSAAQFYDTVENWLHTPLPQVGVDYAASPDLSSRMIRLTTGPKRLAVMIGGALCLLAGLVWSTGQETD